MAKRKRSQITENSDLAKIKEEVMCVICYSTTPLKVGWPLCGHLFCYPCVYSLMSAHHPLEFPIFEKLGNISCENIEDEDRVECPVCKCNKMTFTEFFSSSFDPLDESCIQIPSPALRNVNELVFLKESKSKVLKVDCPYCDKHFGSTLSALQHVHHCSKRRLPCFLCSEPKMPFRRHPEGGGGSDDEGGDDDEYGSPLQLDCAGWKQHLLTECQGKWKCEESGCEMEVKSRDIFDHILLHQVVERYKGDISRDLQELTLHMKAVKEKKEQKKRERERATPTGQQASA